ncbi:hypothetical protein P872_13695 [Rhodonellum psychrophilum GCM71 = DSM 17998]|uniref:N-acetyltransferase domain-containing protein n=2 Tax=Rhodonellum TaxID=336827 RepID=U5BIX5_9BACT|nr:MULTISPECIES: GNAT family N-acetyltransferase [Rhodonellum]ERM80350.1 hypothetical protein P872_13695 [Rhodonellum psychrophilum GCM71 = DSM 17998]SDZ58379.1 dTDP-4-amino-4,6-dideoxy-D-galactose acyltransferase [Rhodonellum ikkaensis]
MQIQNLPWDTDFFGYPVGKIDVEVQISWEEFLQKAQDFQLVYLFSESLLEQTPTKILHVDTKCIFQKTLVPQSPTTKTIHPFTGEMNPELKALALQSGEYSRFRLDGRLVDREFERLYSRWMENALEEDSVFVFQANGEIQGMVTLSLSGENAQIGLIAVGEKARGQGIGIALLQIAESAAFDKGARRMRIPTQKTNLPAINLYQKLGYALVEEIHIYHYWDDQKTNMYFSH